MKNKVEIEVSDQHEGTRAPYWLILDPIQNMSCSVNNLASQITGPFFSRETAQEFLDRTHYNFSDKARVYCHSGCYSDEYKDALDKAEGK